MIDPKTVWTTQPVEENGMITLSDVRALAQRFETHVRRRNIVFYVYAFANIAASFWLISSGRLSAYLYPMLLMVAAHLWVLWQVTRRIGARPLPGDAGGRPGLDFYRDELKRQADSLSRAWLWYIPPFMPPFLWELAIWLQRIQTGAVPANYRLFLLVVFGAVCFWTAVWLAFSRASVTLQLRMERLTALKAE